MTSTSQLDTPSAAVTAARPAAGPANDHYAALLRSLDGAGCGAGPSTVIGVASPRGGAGVSTIASNLAIEAARSGFEKVLLIDANLSRSRIHRLFSAQPMPGLAQALSGDPPVDECIQRSSIELLHVLTSGTDGREAMPRFRSQQFKNVLDVVRQEFDFVVVDLPPATRLSLTFTVAGLLDGVLLVVEAERERAENLQLVKRQFLRGNANLLGVVLNKCR